MTWMPTWQHCLDVRLGTCAERVGSSKKLDPTLNTSSENVLHKTNKIQLQ
jgi:hypothetical protein